MSTLTISNLSDGTKTIATTNVTNGSAKAVCRVNTDGTQNFDRSFNCTSLTDNGTGSTTVTVTSAFSGVDTFQICGAQNGSRYNFSAATASASTFNLTVRNDAATFLDTNQVSGLAFGDLA
tara:strand:- start:31 stop:393 length:363 start_codon:yes stop_codon:yes gene_type:complete